jgi:hypothetical protein
MQYHVYVKRFLTNCGTDWQSVPTEFHRLNLRLKTSCLKKRIYLTKSYKAGVLGTCIFSPYHVPCKK